MADKGKGSDLLLALSGSPSAMSASSAGSSTGGVGEPADVETTPPELESGASEILQAMQVGDSASLARALQSFVTMCV